MADKIKSSYKFRKSFYDVLDFHVEGAMLYFRAKKRK